MKPEGESAQRFPKLSFGFLLVLCWLPFPGLFLPFTIMREDFHPGYIEHTSILCWIAMVFYMPGNLLALGFPMLAGHDPREWLMYFGAFAQSTLLSLLMWRICMAMAGRSPSQAWYRALLLMVSAGLILIGAWMLLPPWQDRPAVSYICGVACVLLGARGCWGVAELSHRTPGSHAASSNVA